MFRMKRETCSGRGGYVARSGWRCRKAWRGYGTAARDFKCYSLSDGGEHPNALPAPVDRVGGFSHTIFEMGAEDDCRAAIRHR